MRALDWIGRVLVLALSTLATLSLVASLVTVSVPVPPEPKARDEIDVVAGPAPEPPTVPAEEPAPSSPGAGAGAPPVVAATAHELREMAKWLRALTYAVLGLAGFLAVLVIVAMRATAHLGALADRR